MEGEWGGGISIQDLPVLGCKGLGGERGGGISIQDLPVLGGKGLTSPAPNLGWLPLASCKGTPHLGCAWSVRGLEDEGKRRVACL